MKFSDWAVGLGIGVLITMASWVVKDLRNVKAQNSSAKCGIYQEQEVHIGGVKFVRIRDTCVHLVCMQIITDTFTRAMSPSISCVKE